MSLSLPRLSNIAAEIGRHRSTVYREIKRNFFTDEELPYLNSYYGMVAQREASKRRTRRRKLIRLEALRTHVVAQLKVGWTPEQVTGRMRLERHPFQVSHETIYRFSYSKVGRAEQFHLHLNEHRRRSQPRGQRRHQRWHIFEAQSLRNRLAKVAERAEFGHWECDLMMFHKEHGKVNVTSLVERVSRFTMALRNEDRQSKPIMETLIGGMSKLPANARRSITFDRSSQFSAWSRMKDGMGTDN